MKANKKGHMLFLVAWVLASFIVTGALCSKTGWTQTTRVLRLQSHLPKADVDRALPYFAEMLSRLTKGKFKLELYPVGSIVPAKEMLRALQAGVLDIVHYAEGYFSGEVPGTEAASGLPLAFDSWEEAFHFMWHKGVVDILRTEYAKRGAYFMPWEAWPTALMTRTPVRSLSDLKGMKLRSYGGIAHFLQKCGASVTFISGAELYTALATGVVDGAHWDGLGPEFIMRFHEVLKYVMMPYLQHSWNNILIRKSLWDQLTQEEKDQIFAAAQASAIFATTHTRMLEVYAEAAMKKHYGVQVTSLSEEDVSRARNIAYEAWDEIAKRSAADAEIVKRLKAFRGEIGNVDAAKALLGKLSISW